MQNKKISLEQLTDIIGFRIILDTVDECYNTLGVLHSEYSAIPASLDYISTPKINNYKSIHTSIIGPSKQRIEVQLRTHEMHEFAERGSFHIGNTNHQRNILIYLGKSMIG